MYENVEPWEVLIFLSYKKFYIERMKVVGMLKPGGQKEESVVLAVRENPFTLPYSKISAKELAKFAGTR